ncbi:hypothetical protein BJV85_000021 [Clostridium acetobutylicum]|uniref:Uncharacterized protein n=1 Tax=Clostridium acetobutylicum (strain ATCC 824 / DSM 792 / JCM 1419 / IAM 19013 / LMG 5710 / NBRC 13948 / NRRL B-527 / VKM B-1787 / 2291 / W) TaxID=272562 RepID=Q97MQ9_CLOAB|nr:MULTISPECIES: hypothetical protein [Clostridium]AAK78117.1 Hypothetical protein, CF-4 family [Clostridium acetobutylicum ATCC 824]AEI31071.1 hypothetical protein SMB_G0134 [Clostridium acetobutylicum DSM 1731]AWV81821.1 hypothetical protein DK921_17380 [Clostridium acetobutylicum]MBC2395367.1 hypothetical protein [Clostridium acetobutylicum]MBC2586414.1 hypothetical protein [Clostridium acetobutylicum]
MNIYDVVKILKDEDYNKELIVTKDELKEKMSYPEDDYYKIEKGNGKWFFYHINNERRKEIKLLGEYNNEEEACLHFLLNRLESYYLDKYILSAKRDVSNEEDLELALNKIGIDKSYISYTSKKYNSICIFQDSHGWHTEYIDGSGNEYLKTIGQTKSRCIPIALKKDT